MASRSGELLTSWRGKAAAPFASLYSHGFVRVAVCTPHVAIAQPHINAARTTELARRAMERRAAVVFFPELGLSGYSIDDLAQQDALLDGVASAIAELLQASRDLSVLLVAGAPLRSEGKLFNCALVIHRGAVLGVVPKTYLPSYREFYEKRQYSSAAHALDDTIIVAGGRVPFGSDLIFEATGIPDLALHIEICEDLWTPLAPSAYAALGGATLLANLSASNATIGKADYRRLLCASQSAKCIAAYAYAGAGHGESTTDLAWDGHALVCENGEVIAESRRFCLEDVMLTADVDLDRLRQERARMTSFNDCAQLHRDRLRGLRRIPISLDLPGEVVPLEREVPRYPYVPSDPANLDGRCSEVYNIQVQGLMQRMQAVGVDKLVIGISGGLDSTQALLVAVKAVDTLQLPRSNVLAFTLPGFATSERTHDNARRLMSALRVNAREIDIRPSARQMLADLGHPCSRGEALYDTTFENVQAGERTSHLFRLANFYGGLVVGTSDLSELALGYTTYGVGDQMSHYSVNASVPKTLIQHLIRWVIEVKQLEPAALDVLNDILATRISPELVPAAGGGEAEPPGAEAVIGPYALNDFFLYYISRFGYRPGKVAFMAEHAWSRIDRGQWPDSIPASARQRYDLATVKMWLARFLRKFFETSQFKRSALPNGPKVGSGGSLSPRGDWRAPSDAKADVWVEELNRNVP